MPALATWAIRLALIHLTAAVALGGWLLAARGVPTLPRATWLLPVHLELALLGWTVQLAMGVAYWILPKHQAGLPRGPLAPAVGAILVFNLGVLAVVAAAVAGSEALALAGRLGQLGGIAMFALLALPRIKAFGR